MPIYSFHLYYNNLYIQMIFDKWFNHFYLNDIINNIKKTKLFIFLFFYYIQFKKYLEYLNYNIYIKMQSEKIYNILNGVPCQLGTNQIMQLGAQCSSSSYSLQKFIQIAKTLYKADAESCYKFLQYIEKHQINRNIYKDFVHQPWKIQIYYSLAALSLTKALKLNDKTTIQKLQKQFNKYLNLGANVKSSAEKMYQLLHGFNSYYAGDFAKAISNFNRLEQDKNQQFTIALIGLAQSHFMLQKYDKALEYYKKALISNKNLPTKARLGMAYCFYELQKYQLAEKCFQRILTLDPNSAEAYMGIAIINYRNNNITRYFSNLKKAYKLKPNDPLVILHLSEHMLFNNQNQKCQKLSRKGLQSLEFLPKFLKRQSLFRDDYEVYKARFNNLIGQVYHSKHQFQTAKKYYDLAKQKGLKFNDIALAQSLAQTGALKQALTVLQTLLLKKKPTQLKILAQYYKTVAYLQIKVQIKQTCQQSSPNNYFKQAIKYNKNDYDALIQYSVYLGDIYDKKQTLKILQNALKSVQNSNKQPKVQLLNNIAVGLIQENHIGQADKVLDRAIIMLQNYQQETPEDQVKYHALYLTVHFNKAIVLQLRNQLFEAIRVHENLIKYNRYYIDSYVKLAQILHKLGEKQKCYQLIDNAIVQYEKIKHQQIRLDKLIAMKGHLKHIDNSPSQSREFFKKLGKISMTYDQFYQICLQYQTLIRREADRSIIKKFLNSNRQITIQICQLDHNNVFSYMMLVILFVIDHKISKQQAIQYFNQLKIAEIQFPIIQYNYGVYSLLNEDYQNALFCFSRFKEKTKTNKADQYIALAYFLKEDYLQCIQTLKKYILNQPNNLKYRFQYAYAHEKRVQKLYEQEKNYHDLKLSTKYLRVSKKIFESLARITSAEYVKPVDNPQLKQKIKNQINKIRSESQNRVMYVESQLGWYVTKQKQIIQKQRRIKEQQARKIEQLRKAKEKKFLLDQLQDDEDQSDSQKIRRQRRKKLQQMTLKASQQANQQLRLMQERQKQLQQLTENKKKKRNGEKKPRRNKQRTKQQQKQQEGHSISQQQFRDRESVKSEQQLDQYEGEQIQKHKKKKKKNKDRQGDKKKKKNKKKQRKDSYEDGMKEQEEEKSYKEEDEANQQIQSNPFSDKQQKINEQQELRERQQPQKKPKKKKNDDEQEIDIGDFIIQ